MAEAGTSGWRRGVAALLFLGAGCQDERRPLDGGRPLVLEGIEDRIIDGDPCWRRERRGWHRSVGHCMAMTPRTTLEGVWVAAFEESSFFPGASDKPDPRDPRRFAIEIELDDEAVIEAAGQPRDTFGAAAFHLRFAGRRTRDPLDVDCYGNAIFVYVVDELIEVRPLGEMRPFPPGWFEELARNPPPPTVRRSHGGRWGELEAQAVERCRPTAGAEGD